MHRNIEPCRSCVVVAREARLLFTNVVWEVAPDRTSDEQSDPSKERRHFIKAADLVDLSGDALNTYELATHADEDGRIRMELPDGPTLEETGMSKLAKYLRTHERVRRSDQNPIDLLNH